MARGATLRRELITVPARLARPQRRRVLHLPAHWPWAEWWMAIWNGVFATEGAGQPPEPDHRRTGPTGEPLTVEKLGRPANTVTPSTAEIKQSPDHARPPGRSTDRG